MKLTLEEYASFFENPPLGSSFTISQLNQIVFMHGFLKLHHSTKEHILELIGTLDLIPPIRPTIQHRNASISSARLSADELQRDMEAIGWETCRVGSVLSIEPIVSDSTPVHQTKDVLAVAGEKRSAPKRRGRPPKKKKDLSHLTIPIVSDSTPVHQPKDVFAVAGEKRSAPKRRGRPPKKKKDLSHLFLVPLDSIFIEDRGSL
ncbi:hypothetical protein J5N97_008842 [Dioscorea zingiberensis]|uniref:DUF7787 domain-containing protein n=1 Tax=Dioscorea zingiberensis TaxID=325984 RepID=A0A9D5CX26_9LILI|nr:hypothetical protein J5N97_008842 [Dioscorea zingiberensis]